MAKIIAGLADISAAYDAVFCDLWGCLHDGKVAYPAAVAALQAFRAGGGLVVLVTNAPRPNAGVIVQLDRLGVPRDAWDIVVSSGDAAQIAMLSGAVGQKVHHIGAAKDEMFFTEFAEDIAVLARSEKPIIRVPMAQAEGVVCTGLVDDLTETPEDYRAPLLLAKTMGLTMLCANPDIIVDLGEIRLFCAGALAEAYEKIGGEVLYFGKPHPPIYDLARRRLAEIAGGRDDLRVLCIGDGVFTDVQGGVAEGLDTLFVTGGLAADQFGPDAANPEHALLLPWLTEKQLSASFAIGYLR